jgi:micrococcal nuclease
LNTSCSCSSKSGKSNRNNSPIDAEKLYKVKKVVDGDTFWADDGSLKGLKIRLIGVDTPESRKTFKKEVGYYGKEAKQYMISLISNKQIRLEFDVGHYDRYGRTLAYVYLLDGIFVNAELNGNAMVMMVPPNVKFADEFVKLQQDARKHNRGLWGIRN